MLVASLVRLLSTHVWLDMFHILTSVICTSLSESLGAHSPYMLAHAIT